MAAIPLCSAPEIMDQGERERLILEHLPQVRLIARRIQERLPEHIGLEDLISMGIIGLISAIDHFEPHRNVKLKTYAEYKIRGAILDSLRSLDWAPRQKRRKAKRIDAAIAAAEQRMGRSPLEEEIAVELGISVEEYRWWLVEVRALNVASLDSPAGVEGRQLLHYLPDQDPNLPSTLLERSELKRLLAENLEAIPEMERIVLSLYYQEQLTLRRIAELFKLHESRISQLKARGILRLRNHLVEQWPAPRGLQSA